MLKFLKDSRVSVGHRVNDLERHDSWMEYDDRFMKTGEELEDKESLDYGIILCGLVEGVDYVKIS